MPGDLMMAKKPDLSTPNKAVEYAAQVFERVEPGLFNLHTDIGKLLDVVTALTPIIGMMRAGEWRGRVLAIQGDLGRAAADLHKLHREGAAIAEENGIDVPQPRGGSPR